jgi:hypothetical protein
MIRSIQLQEKEKLQLTIEQQIMKKEHVIDREDEYDPIYDRKMKEHSKRLGEIVEGINDVLEEIKYEMEELNE